VKTIQIWHPTDEGGGKIKWNDFTQVIEGDTIKYYTNGVLIHEKTAEKVNTLFTGIVKL